jgi:hypothetical protein
METSPSESVSPAAFDIDPLTIAIDFSPHDMSGYHVSINSAGNVEVTTDLHSASPTKETAIVDDAALHELRMALRRERFYALPSTLGAPTVDDTIVTFTVVLGRYSHTVVAYRGKPADDEEEHRFWRAYHCAVSPLRDQVKNPKVVRVLELSEGKRDVLPESDSQP